MGLKGHTHAAAYSNSRRRWSNIYVVMVIVCSVFGCVILGLMGLHKLRERRSLNLLIKEKDDQILSLHLLLQKEREHMVEGKRKIEEMKMKMMRLGSHKAELNTKISEMESTISSLKEEQKAVELAFQEKQNEANLIREKYAQVNNDQDPRVAALKEELRWKEGEIEDLKHRLQLHGSVVGSVSTDLPSNATIAEADSTESEPKINEHEHEHDEGRKNSTVSAEAIHSSSENGGVHAGDDDVEPKSKKEPENGKIVDIDQESREQENSHILRGKHGDLRRTKGKRWRSIGNLIEGKRTSLSNAASTMADQSTLNARTNAEDNVQRHNSLINSSSEKTNASIEELPKKSEIKMDSVQHTEENEQSREHISIEKPKEDENEQQHINPLGQEEVSRRNGEEQDAVQSRDSEESEDKEEIDEPDF